VISISDFTQPHTGLVDFLFGGGLLAIIFAAFWVLAQFITKKPTDKQK